MLVPTVDETIGALGLSTIFRVVILAGNAGNATYGAYGISAESRRSISEK